MKKIILYIFLFIGLMPFLLVLGYAVHDAFVGVPGFSIFVPPSDYYYGFDAIKYDLTWFTMICVACFPVTIAWIILLLILPIYCIIKEKKRRMA